MNESYDVRVWGVDAYKGKRTTSYRVRWSVAGKRHARTASTKKLADSFRASLLHSARAGEPFMVSTGLPRSMEASPVAERRWLHVAQEYIDANWDDFSPRHRKSTVEGLVTLTTALADGEPAPDEPMLRRALARWVFNKAARNLAGDPPAEYTEALTWIADRSWRIDRLRDADGVRVALAALTTNLNGERASAATVARKRAALSGALNYAVERKYLPHNPLRDIRSRRQPAAASLDLRVVVNPVQARALLRSVKEIEPTVHGFFACLYYAGLRPAEARNLRLGDLTLPKSGWGRVVLHSGYQDAGTAWTDSGKRGEERHLKHRALKETRPVPLHPELVSALRAHIDTYGTGTGGRLFVTRTGRGGHPLPAPYQNPIGLSTIYRVWDRARRETLTDDQVDSPLAARPYDLRHACVSTWLAAGVDSTQVAQWAGHSVAVLMKVYASSLEGRERAAMRLIEAAMSPDGDQNFDTHSTRTSVDPRNESETTGHDRNGL